MPGVDDFCVRTPCSDARRHTRVRMYNVRTLFLKIAVSFLTACQSSDWSLIALISISFTHSFFKCGFNKLPSGSTTVISNLLRSAYSKVSQKALARAADIRVADYIKNLNHRPPPFSVLLYSAGTYQTQAPSKHHINTVVIKYIIKHALQEERRDTGSNRDTHYAVHRLFRQYIRTARHLPKKGN